MSESALTSTSRKEWLDALKGLAIILVVMSHTDCGVPFLHKYLTACYMPLFFIASGYVFKKKAGCYQRKFIQLLVPYISWAIVYLSAACILYHVTDLKKIGIWFIGIVYSRFNLFELGTMPNIKLLPPGAGPLWFLTCMALSYLLVCPLIQAKSTMRLILILIYLGISACLIFCPILMPWSLDTAFMGALFIYAGYLFKDIRLNRRRIWIAFLVCTPIYLILSHINSGINMSVREYGNLGLISLPLFGIIGILGTVSYATFFMLINHSRLCHYFAYFGRISLTIMCSHLFFARLIKVVYEYFSNQGASIHKAIYLPVMLVATLCCCILAQHVLSYIKGKILNIKQKNATQPG